MEEDSQHTERAEPTVIDETVLAGASGRVLCGRYRLSHLIGSGGMAQVWAATDTVLGRQVAVKLLHGHFVSDQTYVARFRAEARAAARLSHQNIVGVFDTCSDSGGEAIVMELLSATTLRQHLDANRTIEPATTVRIALRVLAALDAAHAAGLVHRDIKPSNILLCDDGRVKIADFGIAKIDDQTDLTQTGSLVGTVAYLAPEQVADEPVDGRADLYALGIVMYECLTGTTPFKGDTKAAVALKRLHATPTDPRRLRPGVPPELAETIMRTLERSPDDRFASASELRAALLSDPIPSSRATATSIEDTGELPAPPVGFSRSERSWLYPALFIILVAVALGTVGMLLAQSTRDLGGGATSTTSTVPTPSAAALDIVSATAFDPEGDGHENDSLAANVLDADPDSAWRTEGYDPPGFTGSKTGVGLTLQLKSINVVDRVSIEGSDNGWSASLFITDPEGLSDFDPASTAPSGTITDFNGSATVDLEGPPGSRTGSVVVLWITKLGSPVDDGRFRVSITHVQVVGSRAG